MKHESFNKLHEFLMSKSLIQVKNFKEFTSNPKIFRSNLKKINQIQESLNQI